ncbi:sporozoite surface protein 2-like [Cucurbita maxima]|uniref:Sporozoite surface protein 2-like n=1 Tax=Cucurbita maxima TaxID=3661 RepID=A0A6J1K179_CUCMA|nr:sporozoite surface protein 2-like [Cucurbita maxima]
MVRGIISPPRSRSSPRESRPFNNNGATNPPSKPNYMSPRRRPTTPINPNELRTHRKEPQPTVVKRPTKPTDRSSNPPRIDPSRPNSKLVPSRPAAPSPNEKKLDTKTKTTTRFSSPRPTKPITPPPSKSNVKGATGSGSRSDFSRAKPSDSHKGSPKNLRSGRLSDQQDEQIVRSYSDGSYGAHTLSDPMFISYISFLLMIRILQTSFFMQIWYTNHSPQKQRKKNVLPKAIMVQECFKFTRKLHAIVKETHPLHLTLQS